MADIVQPGDSGDEVQALQQRLADLGYQVELSGQFDEQTTQAVTLYQQAQGLAATGIADADVLSRLEAAAQGYPQASEYESPEQETESGAQSQVGQLSPDGQHQWDGQQWQPVARPQLASEESESGEEHAEEQGADSSVGQLSPDGRFRWDGQQWQPLPAGAAEQGGQEQPAGQQDQAQPRVTAEQWNQAVASSITILAEGDEGTAA